MKAPAQGFGKRALFARGAAAFIGVITWGVAPAIAQGAKPAISYVTDGGGSTIIIGEGLTKDADIFVWSPSQEAKKPEKADSFVRADIPATPPPDVKPFKPVHCPDSQSLFVSLPFAPAVVWVKTAAGISAARRVNRPEIWNLSDDAPIPGDRLRLFGRNFRIEPFTTNPSSALAREVKTGRIISLPELSLSLQRTAHLAEHEFDVLLPETMPPGEYDIAVHVGSGGRVGWSDPARITVRAQRDLIAAACRPELASKATAAGKIYLVTSASGDGETDDTIAIQKAIDRAAAGGGGVVTLKPGLYAVSRTIHLQPGVLLRGAGRGATTLTVAPERPLTGGLPPVSLAPSLSWQRGYADDWKKFMTQQTPLIWIETRSGVRDLTITGGPGADCAIYVATKDPKQLAEDVSIVRTVIENTERPLLMGPFNPENFGVSVASASRNLTVYQCRMVNGSPLFLYPSRPEHHGTRLIGNRFSVFPRYLTDNVYVMGLSHAVIEDNSFDGGGRALISQRGFHHNWINANVISDTGNRINGCEMIMSEYGGALWRGKAGRATGDTVQALGAKWKPGQFTECSDLVFVFVDSGRGFGQLRRVMGNAADAVTIDRPWDVIPDTTSRFSVMLATYRNLYINNAATQNDGRLPFSYGSMFECIARGQRIYLMEGLGLTATNVSNGEKEAWAILAYNEFGENRLVGMSGITLNAYLDESGKKNMTEPIPEGRMILANRIHYNEIFDFRNFALNQYFDYWRNRKPDQDAAISIQNGSLNLIENNLIARGAAGIDLSGGEANWIRANVMEEVKFPLRDNAKGTIADIPLAKP